MRLLQLSLAVFVFVFVGISATCVHAQNPSSDLPSRGLRVEGDWNGKNCVEYYVLLGDKQDRGGIVVHVARTDGKWAVLGGSYAKSKTDDERTRYRMIFSLGHGEVGSETIELWPSTDSTLNYKVISHHEDVKSGYSALAQVADLPNEARAATLQEVATQIDHLLEYYAEREPGSYNIIPVNNQQLKRFREMRRAIPADASIASPDDNYAAPDGSATCFAMKATWLPYEDYYIFIDSNLFELSKIEGQWVASWAVVEITDDAQGRVTYEITWESGSDELGLQSGNVYQIKKHSGDNSQVGRKVIMETARIPKGAASALNAARKRSFPSNLSSKELADANKQLDAIDSGLSDRQQKLIGLPYSSGHAKDSRGLLKRMASIREKADALTALETMRNFNGD